MEKKKIFIIGVAATVFILIIVTVVVYGSFSKQKEPRTGETPTAPYAASPTVSPDETRVEYTYTNLDGLYFIPSWEYDGLKTAVEDFLDVIGKTDISKIQMLGVVETDDDILYTFWLLLDEDIVLRGGYNSELKKYVFEIETDEEIITKFIDTTEPDGIDDLNAPYAYADLTIVNIEELKMVLPEEAFQRFPNELISFLNTQNELRRYFTISGIEQTGSTVNWVCEFDTVRIDGMNVYVTHTESDIFTFELK